MASPCCTSGFKHEGTPVGEIKDANGIATYFATPKKNKNPEHAILFISDVFGHFNNNKLLADEFANQGYLTVLPDLFNGNPVPAEAMDAGKFDLGSWIVNYQPDVIDPILTTMIKYLRETLGVKRIGAVGYCFGAKYVNRFLRKGKIDVGYYAHPSFFTIEDVSAIEGPLSIAAAEIDPVSPPELRHESEAALIKTGQHWQINLYSGVSHGFGVRGDLSNLQFKWAKEQAHAQAVAWFDHHL
ncbi:dienelactone hydrolase family protein [Penicillium chermesinum]|uniref:Dienelactone hydrolase family protein n=1 Tax=Penicillium chermesinum TaxID=63820 RepID=A0A9W9NCM4_9EURO|nr:dienelactone hydrolase family protein [Penicillium chermesinum]KAJ5217410.1 dienelactone hydrolase family protein [Penicillium chermesinum]